MASDSSHKNFIFRGKILSFKKNMTDDEIYLIPMC